MAANSSISLVSLDFDTIKDSFKTYLKAQPTFQDYDFEGSNINVLLDILSYNTFHNAFYLNMVASESFLDSAQLRRSILSHAKELNYVPRSARSAKATINVSFNSNTAVVTIPKGTSFSTTIGYEVFEFVTNEETVHTSSNTYFDIQNLDVYEGQYITDSFVMNYENPIQRFVLTDSNVDTRSIAITVTEDDTATVRQYVQSSTLLGVKATDNVFFLQGAENDRYEIIFGDDIIGRKPKDGSLIEIEYRVTRGSAGNGGQTFVVDQGFASFDSTPIVELVTASIGGDEHESNESIKYYAPRFFQIQERAVNAEDYEIILKQRFPEINAVSAYGGEEIVPPQYGKVYLSVDISDVDGLPDSKIQEYLKFIKPRTPLTIEAVIVAPEYTYYSVNTTVKYNINVTTLTPDQIKSMVLSEILTYNTTYLDDFKAKFRYSKFLRAIDDACQLSIISNETDIKMYKKILPEFNTKQTIDVDFKIQLSLATSTLNSQYDINDDVTLYTSEFILNGERVRVHDDGNGMLRVVKMIGSRYVVINSNVGTVDYDTGLIQFINFEVGSLINNKFNVYVQPREHDFEVVQNTILTVEPSEVNIDVVSVRNLPGNFSQTCQRV